MVVYRVYERNWLVTEQRFNKNNIVPVFQPNRMWSTRSRPDKVEPQWRAIWVPYQHEQAGEIRINNPQPFIIYPGQLLQVRAC